MEIWMSTGSWSTQLANYVLAEMSLSPAIRGAATFSFEPVVCSKDLIHQSHDLGLSLHSPASDRVIREGGLATFSKGFSKQN